MKNDNRSLWLAAGALLVLAAVITLRPSSPTAPAPAPTPSQETPAIAAPPPAPSKPSKPSKPSASTGGPSHQALIVNLEMGHSYRRGEEVVIHLRIDNPTSDFRQAIGVAAIQLPTGAELQVLRERFDLPASDTVERSLRFTVPTSMPPGSYQLAWKLNDAGRTLASGQRALELTP